MTGGNSGIGVETVRALASAGSRVVLCSRSVEAGEKVAKEITSSGVKVGHNEHFYTHSLACVVNRRLTFCLQTAFLPLVVQSS